MTETQTIGPAMPDSRLSRFTAFLLSGVVYVTFLFTILYAIGFVSGLVVPKAIDTGSESGSFEAIVVNLMLMSLFAVQHSAMARKLFKHWWAPFIPRSAERNTSMASASLALVLLFWQWRPMPAVIWHIQEPEMAMLMATLSFVAWVVVFTGALLTDPSEPFESRQITSLCADGRMPAAAFRPPLFRRFLHQPVYPAIIIALWATPTMSLGHLLLATAVTAYIMMGHLSEERDLIGAPGEA